MSPDQKPTQRMQIRLKFETFHQNRKRGLDRWVAKILQPSPTPRLGQERLALQQPQLPAQAIAQGPPPCRQTVLFANPQRGS